MSIKILVANIGSTSFKFRLYEMETETELVSGGADRIGQEGGILRFNHPGRDEEKQGQPYFNHGEAVRDILHRLVDSAVLKNLDDLDAIAFKAVMGGDVAPVTLVTEEILQQMEYFAPVAPAHNPPYVAAMRMFAEVLKDTLLVAAFDSGFHQTNPDRRRRYAVPPEWAEDYGVKRYGYHGASHRYTANRIKELQPGADRIISCHLGGSSSICAIKSGVSVATSMGLSPQSGLPQGSRVGDLDPFALDLLRRETNLKTDEILRVLGSESGLQALSGTSGDMRDIEEAMDQGSAAAALAFNVYVTAIRDYLGAYLAELGGADAITFSGGIGQKSDQVRKSVCRGLQFAGITIDLEKNRSTRKENLISSEESRTAVWVLETNEELVVARQAAALLNSEKENNNSAG
jgi:acetate kinase